MTFGADGHGSELLLLVLVGRLLATQDMVIQQTSPTNAGVSG